VPPDRVRKLPVDERWQHLTPAQWSGFARDWLAEVRAESAAPEPESQDGDAEGAGDPDAPMSFGARVVMLGFARPEDQWTFIRTAMARAETDDELGAIAAGPVEHLLSYHGPAYIGRVEEWAAGDARVARMLTGVWRHLMSDEVWARLRAIQLAVADKLPAFRPDME
jgi:hypothetical protein